jgi:hypothetical protein
MLPGKLNVFPSILSYVDILGFSNLIKNAKNENQLNLLLNEFNGAFQYANSQIKDKTLYFSNDFKSHSRHIKILTDNIVMVDTYSDTDFLKFYSLIYDLANYQFFFAVKGFFPRGAITFGKIFFDDDLIFGPALIEAYEYESEVAINPRIILCQNAVNKMQTIPLINPQKPMDFRNIISPGSNHRHNLIIRDKDGQYFINYLNSMHFWSDTEECVWVLYLCKHKLQIMKNLLLFANDVKILSKYNWLHDYHNSFCDDFYPYWKKVLHIDMNHIETDDWNMLQELIPNIEKYLK